MLTREDARYRDAELTLASHVYRGRSIGSLVTCHQFPGHDVAFDIGQATLSVTNIPDVFITHGHDDHVGGLGTHHLRRNGFSLEPARYYVQAEDVQLVRQMVAAQAALNRSHPLMNVDIRPVEIGSEFPVGKGNLVVRPFRAIHKIPCFGYGLWGKRKQLKPEYQGIPGHELAWMKLKPEYRDLPVSKVKELRRSGVAVEGGLVIDEEREVCEVAFPGDTNLLILEREGGDVVRQARVLLLECTFLDDEVTPKQTAQAGHVHLDDFIAAARAGAFDKNEVVLLTHFSARYTTDYIRETLNRKLGDEAIAAKVQLCLPARR